MKLSTAAVVSGTIEANKKERQSITAPSQTSASRVTQKRLANAVQSFKKVKLCKRCKTNSQAIVSEAISTFEAACKVAMHDLQSRTAIIENQEILIERIAEHVISEFATILPQSCQ